jgi:hypothetical protein
MRKQFLPLAAGALLLLSGVSAQACDVWRDPELGIWRGNCSLTEDFRNKFVISQSFLANFEHRLILKWPDLHIRKFKFFVTGTSMTIEADIENLGDGNAAASVLAVDATFANPLTNMQQGSSVQFTVNVPALSSNTSQRVSVGSVNVPNNAQDWDLVLLGVIDPPTMAQPVRGAILESDETNNSKNHACRWYGPVPDTSLQPCN